MGVSFHEHEAIVQAIQAGDAEAAGQALRTHVTVQGERFGDLMASISQLAPAAA